MEQNSNRNNAFLMVVENMKASGFLQEEEANNLEAAYAKYVYDLRQKSSEQSGQQPSNQYVENKAMVYDNVNHSYTPAYNSYNNQNSGYHYDGKPQATQTHTATKEETAERNITFILNIGVALILLSGIIFGTTTWGFMNNIGKSILLCSVSVLFFVISFVAKSVIKIPKSSHAFWIMGSLFFPISLLSIGFFRLFGDYLSIWGEGKYLFGILCSLLCLPIYIGSTYRNKSRTFAWITLINITCLFVFFVLSFHPSNNILIMLLLGFNGLLLAVTFMGNRTNKFSLFLQELPLFLQFNLILSTAIALLAFDQSYLYSVNIVIASILFFALSLSRNTGVYDYVFGLLFTGGMFMLSREFHTPGASYIMIPIIGYVFTGLSLLTGKDDAKATRLQIFSGISTLLGFIYAGSTMMIFHSLNDFYVGLVSLGIITINYIYLSRKTSIPLFGILVPIQVLAIIYESAYLLRTYYDFRYYSEYLLLMTILLYVVGYLLNKMITIKISSLMTALVNTLVIFLICIIEQPLLLSLSIVSFVFTAELFIVSRKIRDGHLRGFINYCVSFLLFGSLCLIRYSYSVPVTNISPFAFYFFCALLTFMLHAVSVKKLEDLKKPLFYSGHILMAFLFLLILRINQNELIYTVIYLLLGLVYVYSVIITSERERVLWLYAGLVNFTLIIHNAITQIHRFYAIDFTRYSLYVCGFLFIGFYFILRNTALKKHVAIYLCVITGVMVIGNLFASHMLWYEYVAEIVFASFLCLCLWNSKLDMLTLFPLALIFFANHILIDSILKDSLIALPIIMLWFILLVIVGIRKYQFVFNNKLVDWFNILALISVFNLRSITMNFNGLWLISMFPGLLGATWFYINRKRLFEIYDEYRLGNLLFSLSLLWPYYSLLNSISSHIQEYWLELALLPLILLTYIGVKWIYRDIRNSFLQVMEYIIPSIVYVALLSALLYTNSLSHSLILGVVGLISILYAFTFKTKSTLILGGVIILTSVFIQTRAFWFNIQWWVYLLILGSILIIVASFNEYQKNKRNTDVLSQMSGFFNRFSDWE